MHELCKRADEAIDGRRDDPHPLGPRRDREWAPIPSLLAVAGLHNHLVRERKRTQVGLVLETGDAREAHHFALLHRLRRGRDQPVPGARDAGADARRGAAGGRLSYEEAVAALPEGDQEGRRQDHVQDGHLDDPELPRRADLRGDRARAGADRPVLHVHGVAHRRHRHRGGRDRLAVRTTSGRSRSATAGWRS